MWVSVVECGCVSLRVAQFERLCASVGECGLLWVCVGECRRVWLREAAFGCVCTSVGQCR